MNKRFIVAAGVLVAAILVASIVFASRPKRDADRRISVTASFYTLAEFAERVGGDLVSVKTITPAGVEPHDFEPSPQDITALQRSKVFVYSGAGFEPWADKVLPDLENVTVIKASKGVALMKSIHEEEGGGEAITDPHFYLDPVLAQKIVKTIAGKLGDVDPDHRGLYESNANAYIRKLADLDEEFREGLKTRRRSDIITSHAAFAYLAKRYGLRQVPIAGLAEEEPSPTRLAEIAKFAKENNVKYIFFETLVSSKFSETVAEEVGAETLVLNPLEGLTLKEQRRGKNYISVMRENLRNLRIALECK